MGKVILKDCSVKINSVDLSDHASKVTILSTFNEVDVTAFGATLKEIAQGVGDGLITVDFFQDYASSSVDATLWPLSQSGSVFEIVIKPTSATVSPTNPSYTMQGICSDYSPIDGSVGAASTTSVKFPNAGTAGIVRGTA